MFVINANASGSASATAYATGSGGNTTSTTVSGYYDIPMNGSTYNMFSRGPKIAEGCATCFSCTNTAGTNELIYSIKENTTAGRNGNDPTSSSVVENTKIEHFDQDVLYPDNMLCACGYKQFVSYYRLRPATTNCVLEQCQLCFGEHTLDTVVEIDLGSTPALSTESHVSRKVFGGGEKVGKNINTQLVLFKKMGNIQSGATGSANCGRTTYVSKCPFVTYIDMGLLHTDGSKTPFFHKEVESEYYDGLTVEGGEITCTQCGCADEKIQMVHGTATTSGAIACPGDRIYYETGVCAHCMLYDVYTTTKTSSSCNQAYGYVEEGTMVAGTMPGFIYAGDSYQGTSHVCYASNNIVLYSAQTHATQDDNRFNGIQFSIE